MVCCLHHTCMYIEIYNFEVVEYMFQKKCHFKWWISLAYERNAFEIFIDFLCVCSRPSHGYSHSCDIMVCIQVKVQKCCELKLSIIGVIIKKSTELGFKATGLCLIYYFVCVLEQQFQTLHNCWLARQYSNLVMIFTTPSPYYYHNPTPHNTVCGLC